MRIGNGITGVVKAFGFFLVAFPIERILDGVLHGLARVGIQFHIAARPEAYNVVSIRLDDGHVDGIQGGASHKAEDAKDFGGSLISHAA